MCVYHQTHLIINVHMTVADTRHCIVLQFNTTDVLLQLKIAKQTKFCAVDSHIFTTDKP